MSWRGRGDTFVTRERAFATNGGDRFDFDRWNVTIERSIVMMDLSFPGFHRRIGPRGAPVATICPTLSGRYSSREPFEGSDATDEESIVSFSAEKETFHS
jgi:hypothetical protein